MSFNFTEYCLLPPEEPIMLPDRRMHRPLQHVHLRLIYHLSIYLETKKRCFFLRNCQKYIRNIVWHNDYRQACTKRSHAVIVFTRSKNRFFALLGRHVAPINVKFGTGEPTFSPLPHNKVKYVDLCSASSRSAFNALLLPVSRHWSLQANPQPGISENCKTTWYGLVYHTVCLFAAPA